jgi:hypothetical protein
VQCEAVLRSDELGAAGPMIQRLRRAVWGPVQVVTALVVLAVAVAMMPAGGRLGWLLTWLLLGLTAGYALSGSA